MRRGNGGHVRIVEQIDDTLVINAGLPKHARATINDANLRAVAAVETVRLSEDVSATRPLLVSPIVAPHPSRRLSA